MKRFKLRYVVPLVAAMAIIASCATTGPQLATPDSLVLNRGHMPELSFGGPMGLSWGEVDNRSTFSVYAFRNERHTNPRQAAIQVEGIDALYLSVNDNVPVGEGPFWFRVRAVSEYYRSSAMSAAMGPFWNTMHSSEYAASLEAAQAGYEIFANPNIPVILLDARTLGEREAQGSIPGDIHVVWPNAAAVAQGVTHADFQRDVLAIWRNFIANDLTAAQRATLNPALQYKDIVMFLY